MEIKQSVVLAACLLLSAMGEAIAQCPVGWQSFQGNCYYRNTNLLNRADAAAYCASQNSFLVDIQSKEENDFVLSYQVTDNLDIWIGYTTTVTISTPSDFVWDRTGTTGSFAYWSSDGEPNNNRANDDCAIMYVNNSPAYVGGWSDFVCTSSHQSVCKQVSTGVNVTVNCTSQGMSFAMLKSLLNNVPASNLYLSDGTCQPQESGSYYQLTWGLNECGNQITYTANKTTYTNVVTTSSGGVISRVDSGSFTVLCSFDNNLQISQTGGLQPIISSSDFTEQGFGTYTVSMDVMDSSYTNAVTSFPMEISLSEFLYFRLRVQSSDSQLDLFAVRCYATPLPSSNSAPQYEFMKEDCTTDATMFVNASSADSITFGLQAFQFVGQYTYVYTHCDLAVCQSNQAGNRCSQGCLSSRRKKRQVPSGYAGASEVHTISQGPFTLRQVQQAVSTVANQPQGRGSSAGQMAVISSLFSAAVAIFVHFS